MSHYSVKPLQIALRPSRLLGAVLLGLHAMVLLIIMMIPVPWFFRLILGLLVIACYLYYLAYQVLLRLPGSVTGLKLAESGELSICRSNGVWQPAEVLGDGSVKPWLTVLNLKLEGRKLDAHVLLLPDSMDQEDFRRLRVWLIWGRSPAKADVSR